MSINTTTAHKVSIILPFGELGSVVEWCRNNCTGIWEFEEIAIPFGDHRYVYKKQTDLGLNYNFYFETERDYFAFIIWKK